MQNFVIRPATPDDADSLLNIYSYYVESTTVSFEVVPPSVEEFRGRIENISSRYPYLVGEYEGKIVGYTYAGVFKGRAAYDWAVETTIYLDRTCKGMGFGTALYSELKNNLVAQGILNMNSCIAVPVEDKEDEYLTMDSMKFHEAFGFELAGRFHKCGSKFGRWYDMIWMEMIIGEHVSDQPKIRYFSDIKKELYPDYE